MHSSLMCIIVISVVASPDVNKVVKGHGRTKNLLFFFFQTLLCGDRQSKSGHTPVSRTRHLLPSVSQEGRGRRENYLDGLNDNK